MDSIKYFNDCVLYKVIDDITRIGASEGKLKKPAIDLLQNLSDFYNQEIEFTKMYFINGLIEFIKMQYCNSFEESYLLLEESKKIKILLDNEYGGSLPIKT